MTRLCACNALSDRVIQVSAESRPAEIRSEAQAKLTTHAAVFDNGDFRGVVPLEEIGFSQPERIFADLIPPRIKFHVQRTVPLDNPLEEIARLMDEERRDWVVVLSAEEKYAGVVTQQSLLKVLLQQTKEISRQKAREAEERFRWLLESTPDAMIIADNAGCIVHVNVQVESVLGYKPDELLGLTVEQLLPENVRHKHVDMRQTYTANPKPDRWAAGWNCALVARMVRNSRWRSPSVRSRGTTRFLSQQPFETSPNASRRR